MPAWSRRDRTVHRTAVAALTVDDHGTGQHQPRHPSARHRSEHHRRAQVVRPHVGRKIVEVDAEPHHRRLVAHRIHTGQSLRDGRGVPDIGRHDLGGLG